MFQKKSLSLQANRLTIKCKTMANSKKFKVEAPSIRAILCEFNYFFATLFADLQRNY